MIGPREQSHFWLGPGQHVNPSVELVNRLWRLCAVLRKDGITYPQYVAELTYLLFLKMMHETGAEQDSMPVGMRWLDLVNAGGGQKLLTYKSILAGLGDPDGGADPAVAAIFRGSATVLREAKNLDILVDAIGKLDWFTEGRDSFGDLYEGLLQKNAEETKRGAGQYFTPRAVIEMVVALIQPTSDQVIQDPAAGTGGFLVTAHRYVLKNENKLQPTITGMENVQETYRLLLMNLYLHGIDGSNVHLGDALSNDHEKLLQPDLILTNPPFGPAGGRPSRTDLSVTATVASYQLPFVEHCVRALSSNGRAAVVVPDNVLFEDGRAKALRQLLMKKCNLHTVLRLPTGIFYAQGVKTNILFFNRSHEADSVEPATRAVWIYDMRTGAPNYSKTRPLQREDFEGFVDAYGIDPCGQSIRREHRNADGSFGRFRCFTREEIADRGDNLDIVWLKPAVEKDALTNPEEIAAAIEVHLASALGDVRMLVDEMKEELTDRAQAETSS